MKNMILALRLMLHCFHYLLAVFTLLVSEVYLPHRASRGYNCINLHLAPGTSVHKLQLLLACPVNL